MKRVYRFDAVITQSSGIDAAYVVFPYDIKKEFGRGRVAVEANFDGVPYRGSIVNMGVRDEQGHTCYVIGVTKEIRRKICKSFGDIVRVEISAL